MKRRMLLTTISALTLTSTLFGIRPHTVAAASINLVGNAGFEAAVAQHTGGSVPVTTGNWTAVDPGATEVNSPAHTGSQSASTQAFTNSTGAFFEQDFQNFPFNQSYQLSFWVYPQQGTQSLQFATGWDRGSGAETGNIYVSIAPSGTTFGDWNHVTASGPAMTYGQWHQITIVQDACTQTHTWSIDGQSAATTATTVPAPQLGTILFGQPDGTSPENDQFYWDDVSLQTVSCPSTSTPPTVDAGPGATINEGGTFTSSGSFTGSASSNGTSTSSNLVGNVGFETAAAQWAGGGVPVTTGNWTAVDPGATQVNSPVHSGSQSASTQAFTNGTGAFFEQDFQNFRFDQSYQLSYWVYPQQGTQSLQFLTGWDRGSGNVTGNIGVSIAPSGTTFYDWHGVTAQGPAMTYGKWHQITIVEDACTQTHTWSIDGQSAATTTTTVPSPQLGTILFGQPDGTSPESDQFYWDDVSLQTVSCPSASGPSTGAVDYGDGSGSQPLTLNTDGTFNLSHIYGIPGVYTATVQVTSGGGMTGSGTSTVTVNNVAPTVASLSVPATPTHVNTPIHTSAGFTDPGLGLGDTNAAAWNWGDGTTSTGMVSTANGVGTANGDHTYAAAGIYTVTLTVTDSNGATGTLSRTVQIDKMPTTLTAATTRQLLVQGQPATLSATLTANGSGLAGKTVTLALGSQSCHGTTTASGAVSCTIPTLASALGPATITGTFAEDAVFLGSSSSQPALVYANLASGSFVLGDTTVANAGSSPVTFSGPQWAKSNALSGGSAPDSFKGFASSFGSSGAVCGGTWTASPGNSGHAPSSVPAYMAVIVASHVDKSGPTISGDITEIAIVKTDSSQAGSGTVVATLPCQP